MLFKRMHYDIQVLKRNIALIHVHEHNIFVTEMQSN